MDEQELDKQLQEMEGDTQVQAADADIAQAQPKKKRITVAELNKAIDNIQDVEFPETLNWVAELDTRLEMIERGSLSDRVDVAADIAARLDNQDAAIGALANALRAHIEEPAAEPAEPEPEIGYAQPPQRTYDEQARISDITGMANACQTMADVLLICRYLKEDPSMTDDDRNEILNTACRSSGTLIMPGLQIRAGVKFTGA